MDRILARTSQNPSSYTRHFNQSEEFFVRLSRPYTVPSFAIHHDIRNSSPSAAHAATLRELMTTLQEYVPEIFQGLRYRFDPGEILRPLFYQVFRIEDQQYLYQLRLDLVCRPQVHTILEQGTNDTTPVYRTRDLIVEPQIIPLREVIQEDSRPRDFVVEQMISDTWIGETGRGYFVQGIWIDSDLNKFFTKLVIPPGKRIYPYYPFTSRYRSVCHSLIQLDLESRKAAVPRLHRVTRFLRPHMTEIEQVLRESEFREDLELFSSLRNQVPPEWLSIWDTLHVQVYLNEQEMKEFEVVQR